MPPILRIAGATEGVQLEFEASGVQRLAEVAFEVNERPKTSERAACTRSWNDSWNPSPSMRPIAAAHMFWSIVPT